MEKFMTEETPGKVLSLLGLALSSMFFMFAVTVSGVGIGANAQNTIPDPFAASKLMAVVDVASNSYAGFLHNNLTGPAGAQLAFVSDNIGFISSNASFEVSQVTGYSSYVQTKLAYAQRAQVAGAFTDVPYSGHSGSEFSIAKIFGF
jgi:predicted ATP-grasp superfamily ATP-dependent carboligase